MAALLKLSLLLLVVSLVSARKLRNLQNDYIVNPYVCTPGTNYNLDCNTCICQKGSVGACTLMACNLGPDECIPGSVFQIRGQLCRCPNSGYKWHSDCFATNYYRRYNSRFANYKGMIRPF